MNAHHHARLIDLVLLDLEQEAPAVNKAEAVAATAAFRRFRRAENRKRIILRARHASDAVNAGFTMYNRCSLHRPLPAVPSIKGHQFKALGHTEIHTARQRALHANRNGAPVDDLRASRQNVGTSVNGVLQDQRRLGSRVLHGDLQRFHIFAATQHRQPAQLWLFRKNTV